MDEQPAVSSNEDTSQREDKTEYPPLKKVLPTVAAVWLVFFVVAIVSAASPSFSGLPNQYVTGSYYHRYSYSYDLKRVQQFWSYSMV